MNNQTEMKKAGFAAIVGLPNVGKSTLMNHLIGQKIAITSYKPQTTRKKIRTIYTDERGQIVFLDTPGMQREKTGLGEYMYHASVSALSDVDLVLFLMEAGKKYTEKDEEMIRLLAPAKNRVMAVLTKIDKFKKEELLPMIRKIHSFGFDEIWPVSAQTGDGMEELLNGIFDHLPEGEPFYDEEMVTIETQRDIAAEIIREKALRLLQEEVPHGIAVTIESMKERTAASGEPICDIDASIICDKESHKAIIIGRKGAMIRRIGTDARADIEAMMEEKVNLKLFVKVREHWKDNDLQLKQFGYDVKTLRPGN